MTDVKIYWRDKVSQLLGWATGLFFIFLGWSIDKHDKFELGPWSQKSLIPGETRDAALRAIFLIAGSCLYAVILPLVIKNIYRRFLREGTDETVMPEGVAFACALSLAGLTLLIALLISLL